MFKCAVLKRLASIESKLDALTALVERSVTQMAGELDALTKQVTDTTTVEQSAVTLLNGLKGRLDEAIAANNPAALKTLSATLGTQTQALAAAIAANTPAAPTPAPG